MMTLPLSRLRDDPSNGGGDKSGAKVLPACTVVNLAKHTADGTNTWYLVPTTIMRCHLEALASLIE